MLETIRERAWESQEIEISSRPSVPLRTLMEEIHKAMGLEYIFEVRKKSPDITKYRINTGPIITTEKGVIHKRWHIIGEETRPPANYNYVIRVSTHGYSLPKPEVYIGPSWELDPQRGANQQIIREVLAAHNVPYHESPGPLNPNAPTGFFFLFPRTVSFSLGTRII